MGAMPDRYCHRDVTGWLIRKIASAESGTGGILAGRAEGSGFTVRVRWNDGVSRGSRAGYFAPFFSFALFLSASRR